MVHLSGERILRAAPHTSLRALSAQGAEHEGTAGSGASAGREKCMDCMTEDMRDKIHIYLAGAWCASC